MHRRSPASSSCRFRRGEFAPASWVTIQVLSCGVATNAGQSASFPLSLLFDRTPGGWRHRAHHFSSSCRVDLQEILDLAVPLGLAIHPVPDRLLLNAHLLN